MHVRERSERRTAQEPVTICVPATADRHPVILGRGAGGVREHSRGDGAAAHGFLPHQVGAGVTYLRAGDG